MTLRWSYWLMSLLTCYITTNFVCEAIVCYECDSVSLEACTMSLDGSELPYVECTTSQQCMMSIVDSVTYRGCSTDTPPTGATYSKSCTDNLCNKGAYPPGRLKCHHCNGIDCVAAPESKPRPCRLHLEEDQCYTEVIDANEVYRGCSSDTNHTVTGETLYCEINGCNGLAGATTLSCAQCDSRTGRGCKMDLFEVNASVCNVTQYEICEVDSLLTHQETCFLYHNLNTVVRGCTRDMPEDWRADTNHTEECSNKDFCNAKCLEQQKCLICDSFTMARCRSDSIEIKENTCGSAEASSCHACEYENWEIQRGCGAPPPPSSDISRCYECGEEGGCNATPFRRCYKCSTAINGNCASWDRPGFVDIEECEKPGADCVIAALADGPTVRGCESETLQCNGTVASCFSCQGSFCNIGPYPAARLRCFQCDGSDSPEDNDCAVLAQDPLPCPQLELEPSNVAESCFEYFHPERGTMIRGCRSNSSEYLQCMLYSGCRLCREDGCNSTPATRLPSLQCYQCNRDLNPNCQMDQMANAGDLIDCTNPVPFGLTERCYITRHLDGTTTRGCAVDQSRSLADRNSSDQTSYCSSNGCNYPSTTAQYCIRCTADLERGLTGTCIESPHLLDPQICLSSSSGCFTLTQGSLLIRGCSHELPASSLANCKSLQDPKCIICEEQFCKVDYTHKYDIVPYSNGSCQLSNLSFILVLIFVKVSTLIFSQN